MHSSFATLAQLMSSRCGRLSQHDEYPRIDATDASRSSPPLTTNRTLETSNGRPYISEPIAETSADHFHSGRKSRKATSVQQSSSHEPQSTNRSMRRPSEMPLNCHPPYQKSWLEVQPLTTRVLEIGPHLVQGVSHASSQSSISATTTMLKEPPRSMSSCPPLEHIPTSHAPLHTQKPRNKHRDKPTASNKQMSTSTNLFDKHIPPLRPHTHHDAPSHPAISRSQFISTSTNIQHTTIPHTRTQSYLPVPSALQTLWARRRSSHVILADSTLQLKLFSELNVELDEVMNLYTPSKMV